ncbi:hypothetical protein [Legionella saoudiensis]|uniref:hypothetical protein n=1 Tax=Legionella saoudiensis TaxID=1750561 RepID=UPI00072FA862|nr:hypothetical protein [Legionella saoudiensis]
MTKINTSEIKVEATNGFVYSTKDNFYFRSDDRKTPEIFDKGFIPKKYEKDSKWYFNALSSSSEKHNNGRYIGGIYQVTAVDPEKAVCVTRNPSVTPFFPFHLLVGETGYIYIVMLPPERTVTYKGTEGKMRLRGKKLKDEETESITLDVHSFQIEQILNIRKHTNGKYPKDSACIHWANEAAAHKIPVENIVGAYPFERRSVPHDIMLPCYFKVKGNFIPNPKFFAIEAKNKKDIHALELIKNHYRTEAEFAIKLIADMVGKTLPTPSFISGFGGETLTLETGACEQERLRILASVQKNAPLSSISRIIDIIFEIEPPPSSGGLSDQLIAHVKKLDFSRASHVRRLEKEMLLMEKIHTHVTHQLNGLYGWFDKQAIKNFRYEAFKLILDRKQLAGKIDELKQLSKELFHPEDLWAKITWEVTQFVTHGWGAVSQMGKTRFFLAESAPIEDDFNKMLDQSSIDLGL